MGNETGCYGCQVVRGERRNPGGLLLDRDGFVAVHIEDVAVPGYLLLVARRHVTQVGDLTPAEAASLGTLQAGLARVLARLPRVERVYLASIGELTPHVHLHLLPRYEWMLSLRAEGGPVDGFDLWTRVRRTYHSAEWLHRKASEIEEAAGQIRRFVS